MERSSRNFQPSSSNRKILGSIYFSEQIFYRKESWGAPDFQIFQLSMNDNIFKCLVIRENNHCSKENRYSYICAQCKFKRSERSKVSIQGLVRIQQGGGGVETEGGSQLFEAAEKGWVMKNGPLRGVGSWKDFIIYTRGGGS